MKRIILVLCAAFVLAGSCFAVEGDSYALVQDDSLLSVSAGQEAPSDFRLTDVSVLSVVSPVEPTDTSGLKAVLLQYLGSYDPIIVEYQYTNSNNYVSYIREVQPDYVWLCSAAILLVLIFCTFRLGGSLLCRQ